MNPNVYFMVVGNAIPTKPNPDETFSTLMTQNLHPTPEL